MRITVLLAGVHDPKWPIGTDPLAGTDHGVFSPFDEAALEIALKLRDAVPGTMIAACLAGGTVDMRLARAVVALGIGDVATMTLPRGWDQAATARALATACGDSDLVLIGREFGDCDDGLVPALLARTLGLPLFARVQAVESRDTVRLLREGDGFAETLGLTRPVVASVTNDRRARLRKPLMKNVMLARQAPVGTRIGPTVATTDLTVERAAPRLAGRRPTACTMLPGTPADQAQALAAVLWEARA